MSYIRFDKTKLINLEYSLSREFIRSNRSGAYASTTIIDCNTRRYHGLLVAPQPAIDNELHVLLSALDETVIQHDAEFNLSLRKYPGGTWQPKGHKYIRDFETDPIPVLIYRVGGVVLKKELLFATGEDRIMIKYTLLDAHSPTTLRFKPFLAFRNRHTLQKANIAAETNYIQEEYGISMRLYEGYSRLYMQWDKQPLYVHVPHWYYNIEYIHDQERGYDYSEDLFVPGYFEIPIDKDETIIFSAGMTEDKPGKMKQKFNKELKLRIPRNSFENCLINSAQQFLVQKKKKTEVITGFPWYSIDPRESLISLPGLTLETGEIKLFRSVLKTMISEMQRSCFSKTVDNETGACTIVDTSLWFFWVLQQYIKYTADWSGAWKNWGITMKKIIESFITEEVRGVYVEENGLITPNVDGAVHTWMNAFADGMPVTPRNGMAVEVNALWYNALCFFNEISQMTENDKPYEELADRAGSSFKDIFWNQTGRYLYDFVNGDYKDDAVRANQLISVSLDNTPLNLDQIKLVLDVVTNKLLTKRGIRTLSPKHSEYKGKCTGNQNERNKALHQGCVFPFLLGHYADASFKIHGRDALPLIEKLFYGFEEVMKEDGIGTVSEFYDGNPPHRAGGAVSHAPAVAELLRIGGLIKKNKI